MVIGAVLVGAIYDVGLRGRKGVSWQCMGVA